MLEVLGAVGVHERTSMLLFCAGLALPNTPEVETAEIEVRVTHPSLGKCPAIPHPYLSREDQKMLDWKVTGDPVFLVINQYCPQQTSLERSIERVGSMNPDLRQPVIGLRSDAFLPENE